MAEFSFLNTARIKVSEIQQDVRSYLSRVYGNAENIFTTASPFAQMVKVASELTGMIMYYIEDATVEQNIMTAQQPESIYGLARLAGHDPIRGLSAMGEVELTWKPGMQNSIAGNLLLINTNSQVKSNNNSCTYLMRTSNDLIAIDKTSQTPIRVPIIEGTIELQTVTGTGESFQTFNIQTGGATAHDRVTVAVNGEKWRVFETLYDMQAQTKGVVVKTGVTGGLDMFFGNGNFGQTPNNGAIITVEYIKTKGAAGNLGDSSDVTFRFVDVGYDAVGNEYDLNNLLEIRTTSAPKMGANQESIEFTKLIAPLTSKSFVLATPENYEHFLSRYNMFSYIDAYNLTEDQYLDDDNVMYLFLMPDAKAKLKTGQDYFSIPVEEFFFMQSELDGIREAIELSGQQMVTTEISFVEPKAKMYAMNVWIRHFEGFDEVQLAAAVRNKISTYLMTITRRDRLPKSDIIALLEGIEGIDSVNVQFISKSEEDAIRTGSYTVTQTTITPQTPVLDNSNQRILFFKKTVTSSTVTIDPVIGIPADVRMTVTGLDEFGDAVIGNEEVAMFRGNWNDRLGVTIKDGTAVGEPAALSISFAKPIPRTVFTQIQSANRRSI